MAVDYDAVIADLEAKRAAFNGSIDAAIQGIRSVLNAVAASQASSQLGHGSTSQQQPALITPDAFFGLNLADAAIRYLQVVKKQQTTREIADALESANYHHTSQNFVNTVNTALYRRSKDEQDVVKIGRNWALAEWYPGRRKSSPRGFAIRVSDTGDPEEVEMVAVDQEEPMP